LRENTYYPGNDNLENAVVQSPQEPQSTGREKALPPSNPSAFKTSLAGKSVIVKISLFSRAFSGTIIAVDETGFCFVSEAMIAALRETTGTAMAAMDAPSVYLTFASLEWLVSSQPKAAAASA
jgi:hypothetical protein